MEIESLLYDITQLGRVLTQLQVPVLSFSATFNNFLQTDLCHFDCFIKSKMQFKTILFHLVFLIFDKLNLSKLILLIYFLELQKPLLPIFAGRYFILEYLVGLIIIVSTIIICRKVMITSFSTSPTARRSSVPAGGKCFTTL